MPPLLEISSVPMDNVNSQRDMAPSRVRLLNVEIDNISMDELVNTFDKGLLLTLHVDMIMKLQKDRKFYEILPHFDVVTCDSQILIFAAKLLGTPFKERVSGSDFFPRFYAKYKNDPNITVFMCGGAPGVAELARKNVNRNVGREMIVATDSPPRDYDTRPGEIERMIARINESKASVLVIGLGAGRQEKFIVKYRGRLPYVKMYLPLGGTIDYEAESLKRPPAWITNAGFEWLYRVVREPRQRWRRYFIHQPPFLYLLLKQKLGLYKNPFAKRNLTSAPKPLSESGSR
jgi:N-acetylglucosaminyldiphosphoundecaprenol N-acetyl-beta-D-mannosaminyltransferase